MTPTAETAVAPIAQAAITQPPRQQTNTAAMLSLVMESSLEPEAKRKYATRLIEAEMERFQFSQDLATATQFARSGFFDDVAKQGDIEQQTAAAMTKIRIGRSWGVNEADAMAHIYVQNGKPSVDTEPVAIKLREAGYGWDIRWHEDKEKRCIGCTLLLNFKGAAMTETVIGEDGKETARRCEVSFTKRDADTALIWEKGKQIKLSEKWNFVSWPRDMYYRRCVGRVKSYFANHVMSGAVTREEAEDFQPVEIQQALPVPAPREKLEVVEPITSGRQSRKKAGAEVIPGTEVAAQPILAVSVPGVNQPAYMGDVITQTHATQPAPVTVEYQPKVETKAPAAETKAPVAETKAPVAETKAPVAETKADQTVASATAPTVDPAKRWPDTTGPWQEQPAMIAAFRTEMQRLGGNVAFNRALGEFQLANPAFMFGNANFRDPSAIAFYGYLQSIKIDPTEPAPEPAEGKKKLFG